MAMESEDTLIRKAIAGDSPALWQLLCLYRPRLVAFLHKHFPKELLADLEPQDVLQDLYFQVCRQIGQFRDEGDEALWRWLVTILRNLLGDALRRQQSAKRGQRADVDEADQSVAAMLDELAVYKRTPSRSAMAHELLLAVERSLAALPEDYRTALQLRHIDGLDVEQAAARMNRTPGALQMLCCRALKAMRVQLRSDPGLG